MIKNDNKQSKNGPFSGISFIVHEPGAQVDKCPDIKLFESYIIAISTTLIKIQTLQ